MIQIYDDILFSEIILLNIHLDQLDYLTSKFYLINFILK